MSDTIAIRGSLFTPDFLTDGIRSIADRKALAEGDIDWFSDTVEEIFARFPISQRPNETQTEDDLIWPILEALGWTAWLRQQNLSPRGGEDVPDGILFESAETKDRANGHRCPGHLGRYLCRHLTIEWQEPVKGPLALGAGVGYGFGLFVPVGEEFLRQ